MIENTFFSLCAVRLVHGVRAQANCCAVDAPFLGEHPDHYSVAGAAQVAFLELFRAEIARSGIQWAANFAKIRRRVMRPRIGRSYGHPMVW